MKSIFHFLCAALLTFPAFAQDNFVEKTEIGVRDWENSFIEAKGQGTARYMGNRIQEELMAKQAAHTQAQAKLLELTKGVRLTGLTTLGSQAQSDTRAATRIKGTLKGAHRIDENVTWHKDKSSRRGEVPFAEVTLRLCISPSCQDSQTNLNKASLPTPPSVEQPTTPTSDEFTSVIVDLNQALYLPALAPEFVNENNEILYSVDMVNEESRNKNGVIHYVKSVSKAKEHALSGAHPLIVQIKRITKDNRIVLHNKDQNTLKSLKTLKEGRVIVALD